eukprot:1184604-Prorocentrum_minimum.AAC.1
MHQNRLREFGGRIESSSGVEWLNKGLMAVHQNRLRKFGGRIESSSGGRRDHVAPPGGAGKIVSDLRVRYHLRLHLSPPITLRHLAGRVLRRACRVSTRALRLHLSPPITLRHLPGTTTTLRGGGGGGVVLMLRSRRRRGRRQLASGGGSGGGSGRGERTDFTNGGVWCVALGFREFRGFRAGGEDRFGHEKRCGHHRGPT